MPLQSQKKPLKISQISLIKDESANKFKNELEVILFWKQEPMSVKTLAELLGKNIGETRKALAELMSEYELRDGGLEITSKSDGYVIQPKDTYKHIADKISPINIKTGTTRTLALIMLKEPVEQRHIIQTRGSSAYDHIRELLEMNWIEKESSGATFLLRTTKLCRQYFSLSEDGKNIRSKLENEIQSKITAIPESEPETQDNLGD